MVPTRCNDYVAVFMTILSQAVRNQMCNTDMRRLTTGIRSDKCVVRRFRRCANVIECIYTNVDSTVQPTAHLGYTV
jgi:hypothetical protein